MKKIISIISVVCMMLTLFTFNVSAATDFTLSIADDVTTANYGDEIVALITLSDTAGIKAIGAGVAFDSDFVLGFDADTDEEIDENWVAYDYYSAYNSLGAKYKWGTPTYGIDTAVMPGYTYANAQYAKASAVTSSKTNVLVFGVVLKVNTEEKKMAKISMPTTYWGDSEGNKTIIPAQEIEIALNGYVAGGGSEETFVVDVEAGYSKDTIAIFAKNVTDEAFAAGTYGVIFGGNKYAAGINPDTACEAGKTFVVKFVGGAEKLASGAYKYQAYYNNGVDVTPEKVLNIQ